MRENTWLWLVRDDRLWLVQRPDTGVWAGLWSFPEFESLQALQATISRWPGDAQPLETFKHVLTHLDWTLHPVLWTLPPGVSADVVDAVTAELPPGRWVTVDEALAMGVPSPLRQLVVRTLERAKAQRHAISQEGTVKRP